MTSLGFPHGAQRFYSQPPIERSLGLNVSWTLTGNVVYAACQWGMLVVLAKLGSPEMVGRFAFALAVTAPVFMLTNLQLRAVQATDMANRFAFADYLALRILCTGLALSVIAGLAYISRSSFAIAAVIVVVGFAKGFESISDAVYGLVQRHERMDLIARSMMLKGLVSIVAFTLALALTGKLVLGAAALAAAWCVVLLTYDFGLARRFAGIGHWAGSRPAFVPRFPVRTLLRIAWLSLPLGVTLMLGSLNTNLPRYFIEHYAGTRELGFFAAIAYLMVAGNLILNAVGQSATPRLASYYASGNATAFRALLLKLCGVAAVPGVAGILVAAIAGKPVLRLLYRADYASHSDVLTLLMIAAAIGYMASIPGTGVMAARIFKPQPVLLAAVVLLSLVACFRWIPLYGLRGAAYVLILAAVAQLVGTVAILLFALWPPHRIAFAGLRSPTLAEHGPRLEVFQNFPCWETGSALLKQYISSLGLRTVADVGGGAYPLLDSAFIQENGIEYSLLDISQTQLDKAPAYCNKIRVDLATPEDQFSGSVGKECFDLVFSHMFLEHVRDPLRVHRNIHTALKPGGIAIHFFASSNNLPLTINRFMPSRVTNIMARISQPGRELNGDLRKFPAYYALCGAPSKALHSKYREIGFDVVRHTGFIGHDYYKRVPVLREIERGLRPVLVAAGVPLISDSLLILRKRGSE